MLMTAVICSLAFINICTGNRLEGKHSDELSMQLEQNVRLVGPKGRVLMRACLGHRWFQTGSQVVPSKMVRRIDGKIVPVLVFEYAV